MQITLSFSHYSFGIAFTSVWNILSPDSHMACSFTSLRSLPKNNLLREAFRPLSKKRQHHPRLSTLSSHFSPRYLFVSLFITSPPLEIKLTEGRNFILCLAHSNHSENISWMKDRKESRRTDKKTRRERGRKENNYLGSKWKVSLNFFFNIQLKILFFGYLKLTMIL